MLAGRAAVAIAEAMTMATELRHHRFTVDEYERMGAAGVLADGVRTELLEGEIVEMPPIGDRHAAVTATVIELLVLRFHDLGTVVWPQNPVVLPPRSMPEPDACLLRPRADRYRTGRPAAADVVLLVEIAESSLRFDLGYKVELYARHAIPEYWVIDVEHRRIEAFADPRDGTFSSRLLVSSGCIAPATYPERTVALDDIFGR